MGAQNKDFASLLLSKGVIRVWFRLWHRLDQLVRSVLVNKSSRFGQWRDGVRDWEPFSINNANGAIWKRDQGN